MSFEEVKHKFEAINLDPKVIESMSKNKKLVARLAQIVDLAGGKADKTQGNLLYTISSKLPPTQDLYTQSFVDLVMKNKWTKVLQIDEAIAFLKDKLAVAGASYVIEQEAFEAASGVGINISDADVTKLVEEAFKLHEKDLDAQKWDFQTSKLLYWCRETQKWADSKLVTQKVNEKMVQLFGEKPENDGKRKKAGKLATDEKKSLKVNAVKDPEAEATTGKSIMDLIGRDCNIGANSEEHLKKHREFTGGRIITRFPPEPNGYLHIGHAKAMRFNFTVAKENGGECYLRFDDTNPVKENHDFIDHIQKNVAWLGYKPWKVTTASGNFDKLYEYAVELIKKGKAYVCHQPADEMKQYRNEKRDSPYRNRTVEENLELFEMMRQGRFAEGECCLRVKMDMQHENPCMRDFVAYRIRYTDHPFAGDKWCIYPTYDYTHCICDSIENITHSLCTLEFEIRRESYYQLLKDLDIYKPYVWEYSRLNISNAVLSKRKIETLVENGIVEGWNDPRLLTLEGLRRRGYTAQMINDFVGHLGVSRKGNENLTSLKILEKFARTALDRDAPRTFGVVEPLLIEITNLQSAKETKIQAPLFPADPSKGTQTYTLTKHVYIEREDFSETHNNKFFGLTPEQNCVLKYGPVIKYVGVDKNADGSIKQVRVEILPNHEEKLKGYIHWVSKDHSSTVQLNLYSVLFTIENVQKAGDDWKNFLNPESLVIKKDSKMWSHTVKNLKVDDRFQFERVGYFVVNEKLDLKNNKIEFNRTVELKESKDKTSTE